MRRPRAIYHLALLPGTMPRRSPLGRVVHVDARRARRGRAGRRRQGRRGAAGDRDVRPPVGRDLPVKEGALEAARCARRRRQGDRRPADAPTASASAIEFTALAAGAVYGPRQRPDGGVVAALRRRRDGRSPATAQRRRPPDARLRVRRRRRRRPRPRPASGGAGWWSTSAPACRRRSATCGRWWRPAVRRPTFGPPRPDELDRFAVSPVRARIHLGWSPWTTLAEGLDALRVTFASPLARARSAPGDGGERSLGPGSAATSGVGHHRRDDDGAHAGGLDVGRPDRRRPDR